MDRGDAIDNALGAMRNALEVIKHRSDCDYLDVPERERIRPCPCSRCEATRALELAAGGWRYLGARPDRMESTSPTGKREKAIVEAWAKMVDDYRLGQILDASRHHDISGQGGVGHAGPPENHNLPTIRDWYVATSVVQWLATNVGMGILEAAGFEYKDKG